jgi:hypothetical protein
MDDHSKPSDDRTREELLEQYVLGRLSPADRAAFEARLAMDPALNEALGQERAILEGVRRAGREDMKRRLAAATRWAPRPGIPWGRIAALAAMIMIVTGIALWQRWFFPAPQGEPTAEKSTAAGQTPGEPTAALPDIADRATTAPESNEVGASTSRDEKRAAPGLRAAAPRRAAEAKREMLPLAAAGALGRTYESSGIMLKDAALDRSRQSRMKVDAAARPDRRLGQTETMKKVEEEEIDSHHYRVDILPASQAAGTAESVAGIPDTIRFTVRVRGDSVVISLPVGVPGTAKDGSTEARVTRLSADSVLIDAAGVRVRAYLPRGFLP